MKAAVIGVLAAVIGLPLLVVVLMGGGSQPKPEPTGGSGAVKNVPAQYVKYVKQAAAMCADSSPSLIAAQIDAESGWNPNASSPVGAKGIAQFMPTTWTAWGRDYNHDGKTDIMDPADAIPSQGALMCANFSDVRAYMAVHQITNGTLVQNALAAYNAGLGGVLANKGFPTPYAETNAYVPRILALQAKYAGDELPVVKGSKAQKAIVAAGLKYLKNDTMNHVTAPAWPYIWGGGNTTGPTQRDGVTKLGLNVGFDCEGLTRAAYGQGAHVDIGRTVPVQMNSPLMQEVGSHKGGTDASGLIKKMQPGDIIGIDWSGSAVSAPGAYGSTKYGHISLYIGSGKVVEAWSPYRGGPSTPTKGKQVRISTLSKITYATWRVYRLKG